MFYHSSKCIIYYLHNISTVVLYKYNKKYKLLMGCDNNDYG